MTARRDQGLLAVSDRVTVLKNSRKVAPLSNEGLTKHHLIQLVIGRDAETLAESYEGGVMLPVPSTAAPVLELALLLNVFALRIEWVQTRNE